FGKNCLKRAVRLDAGDGCIDFGHTFVAFAEGQTELAPGRRFIALDHLHLGVAALREVVGSHWSIPDAGIDAPGIHVSNDIGNAFVDLDITEQAALPEQINEGGSHLYVDGLTLEIRI